MVQLPDYSKSNGVQSLFYVLNKATTITFTKQDKKDIYIIYDFPLTHSQRMGVVKVLTEKQVAIPITLDKLQPGDIIQFWNNDSGHCGVFSHYGNKGFYLYSSYPYDNWCLKFFPLPKEVYSCRIYPKYIKSFKR